MVLQVGQALPISGRGTYGGHERYRTRQKASVGSPTLQARLERLARHNGSARKAVQTHQPTLAVLERLRMRAIGARRHAVSIAETIGIQWLVLSLLPDFEPDSPHADRYDSAASVPTLPRATTSGVGERTTLRLGTD